MIASLDPFVPLYLIIVTLVVLLIFAAFIDARDDEF